MVFRLPKVLLALFVLLLLAVVPAGAALVSWPFDGGDPGPGLTLFADTGFTVSYPVDWAVFTKSAGVGNGWERLLTDASFAGDFTAVTVARRDAGQGDDLSGTAGLGLAVYYDWPPVAGDPFADVFFSGQGQVYSWVYASGANYTSGFVNDNSAKAWLRIRRSGLTVTGDYCVGDDYYTCAFTQVAALSDALLAGPVRVGLFLSEEHDSINRAQGAFDVLTISGNAVPEPGGLLLLCAGAAVLLLLRSHRPVN